MCIRDRNAVASQDFPQRLSRTHFARFGAVFLSLIHISAKVITVAMLGGDCFPSTPIGINLPNADWIRKEYGSKSVTIDNITYAYDLSLIHI